MGGVGVKFVDLLAHLPFKPPPPLVSSQFQIIISFITLPHLYNIFLFYGNKPLCPQFSGIGLCV